MYASASKIFQLQFFPSSTVIMTANNKYAGRNTYGDPETLSKSLAEDLKAICSTNGALTDFETLIEVSTSNGEPIDDKKMMLNLDKQIIYQPI